MMTYSATKLDWHQKKHLDIFLNKNKSTEDWHQKKLAYSLAENDILMSKETVIHLNMACSFTKLEKRESFCRYLCQNLDGNQE